MSVDSMVLGTISSYGF